ncbi:hypothetical protein G7B40_009945 [Aetokthonos hydrillicola Thurmond2011]|jgi:hypothetical protein|uniref:Uncharacterized protein n=1 Tax=Aetokthonos hydrillicola Thurmond2011 TaxID=2712845 RepID=A0AAP5I9F1_9CYAN|nr:hypothetical protein [Aetokthonos hydrillicola]MBO3463509.1 hypothetical protein [Aetokthonos hydrillicola CCALA 1050]MBW4590062.1 hypothetical protein [Aetokthonos hydrillicola CCALA 1050]MDR9894885.1 hypothetical protein [Aetokthonos hydrillicola Thurmond2011]
MGVSSRYWSIWRITPGSETLGYKCHSIDIARKFFDEQVVNYEYEDIQVALLSYFNESDVDIITRAQAGLCLRCYVSLPILKTCQKLDSLFSGEKYFTYKDLLPFVLNDDGQTLVVLDSDRKKQLRVNETGRAENSQYQFFPVKVLQTFKLNSESRMSLDNWTHLQTKQHPEIKDFLSEFGFKHLSDWALLNRVRVKQFKNLSQRDRNIVEVFHIVYRRDRLQRNLRGIKKCPDPSASQLQEMISHLRQRNLIINTAGELMKELNQIAVQLRQYDIWSYREPLEIQDPDTGIRSPRTDLPTNTFNELDLEEREFSDFLYAQLNLTLIEAIEQEIQERLSSLQKSKKYGPLAKQFIPGLQLYYCQGMSLKEIAPKLGMTSWDQARRILNPGELLSKVRTLTVQKLLESILDKAEKKGLTKIPHNPDYIEALAIQIEAFTDGEIFSQALEELRTGKNRSMNSIYSQQLRVYLKQHR